MEYWLDESDWDVPVVRNKKWDEVERLCVCDNDMRSFVVLNGKVYFSQYGQSHYGAIINGLLDIHHLNNIEQLEAKFDEDIDSVVDSVRYSDDGEGRLWDKFNLIQITGLSNLTEEQLYSLLSNKLGVDKESFNVLDFRQEQQLDGCPKIVPYSKWRSRTNKTEQITRYSLDGMIKESMTRLLV